jgi:hypothetical protein
MPVTDLKLGHMLADGRRVIRVRREDDGAATIIFDGAPALTVGGYGDDPSCWTVDLRAERWV